MIIGELFAGIGGLGLGVAHAAETPAQGRLL